MLNKKIEIKLGGIEIPLWFNNYASAELQKMYGADINTLMITLVERLQENYLLILSDLVKAGIKGRCFGLDLPKPEYLANINELIAEEADETLLPVWTEVFEVFKEHMGLNLPQEEPTSKKKVINKQKKATV